MVKSSSLSLFQIIFGKFLFVFLIFVRAHKSSLIIDLVKENPRVNLFLTPSNTPEFSPIEYLFGHVKRKLSDFEFEKGKKGKEKPLRLAFEVMKVMFEVERYTFEGFFKKTFQNMLSFWINLQREKLLTSLQQLDQIEVE